MTQDTEITRVVFRKWKDGEVIALFPDIPSDAANWYTCMSYMHIGQHGAACPAITYDTKKATPEDYNDLKQELEAIGYNLKVLQRIPTNAFHNRGIEWRKTRSNHNTHPTNPQITQGG